MTEREIDEGQTRKHVLSTETMRKYIRVRSSEEDQTYSEYVDSILPDDVEDTVIEMDPEKDTRIKLLPDVHGKVKGMAGEGVRMRNVLALYVMLDAVSEGHNEVVHNQAPEVATLLWRTAPEVDYVD